MVVGSRLALLEQSLFPDHVVISSLGVWTGASDLLLVSTDMV